MNILTIDALIALLIITAASVQLLETSQQANDAALNGLKLVKAQQLAYDAAIIAMKNGKKVEVNGDFCIKFNENCNATNTVSAEFFVYENGWRATRVEVGYD